MRRGHQQWLMVIAIALVSLLAQRQISAQACTAQVLPSDGAAGDEFGDAVSVANAVVIVGAFRDDSVGSAYVYRLINSDWTQEQKLQPATPFPSGWFGAAVSMGSDVVLVGAPEATTSSGFASGVVYSYSFNGATWTNETLIAPSGVAADDEFGMAISISGQVAAIGAPFGGNSNPTKKGAVYLFRWDGSSWTEEQKLSNAQGIWSDRFGVSVALDGNVLVVGESSDDVWGTDSGSAYVYRYDGVSWQFEQQLTASDGASFDMFGRSVALSGDVIVSGAYSHDPLQMTNAGAAYVYRFNGTSWQQEQKLVASDAEATDFFGLSVDVDGNSLVVGAHSDNNQLGLGAGSVYPFTFDGSSWSEDEKLFATDGLGTGFGKAVAMDAGIILVGSPGDDENGPQSGSAHLFLGPLGPWTDQGCALAGVSGAPLLVGCGELTAGSLNSVDLSNAAPTAVAGVFLALASNPVPFKGGTLKPVPFLALLNPPTGAMGTISIPFVMPAGVPAGTELWLQWAIQDAAAINGVALSNAIKGVTP